MENGESLKTYKYYIIGLAKWGWSVAGGFAIWIVLHYAASHMYVHFCAPNSIIGFVMSLFITSTPQCRGLRWLINTGASSIDAVWVLLGTWFCSKLIQVKI
jgi:hypothetical protein